MPSRTDDFGKQFGFKRRRHQRHGLISHATDFQTYLGDASSFCSAQCAIAISWAASIPMGRSPSRIQHLRK